MRAIVVVTSHSVLGSTGRPTGWYLPEVAHVYWPLVEAGWEVEFVSPAGGAAPLDPGSRKLDDPLNARFVAEALDRVERTLRPDQVDPAGVDLIFFAGGHGTMWDFPGSDALAKLTAAVYEGGGRVAAVCHGTAALVNVKLSDGSWLVRGKRVNGFTDAEERLVKLDGVVPFLLQTALEERGAEFVAGAPWSDTVVVDGRLVTGQNPQSAHSLGRTLAG